MEITLIRFAYRSDYTIGKMYVNDAYFCDTLEDTNRDLNKGSIVTGKQIGRAHV